MPARIRQQLSGSLVCFAEIDDGAYLCLYDRVAYLSSLVDMYRVDRYLPSEAVRDRFVGERPSILDLDSRGRIRLPMDLCQRVGIKRQGKAVLAGCAEYLEVWSSDAWNQWQKTQPADLD